MGRAFTKIVTSPPVTEAQVLKVMRPVKPNSSLALIDLLTQGGRERSCSTEDDKSGAAFGPVRNALANHAIVEKEEAVLPDVRTLFRTLSPHKDSALTVDSKTPKSLGSHAPRMPDWHQDSNQRQRIKDSRCRTIHSDLLESPGEHRLQQTLKGVTRKTPIISGISEPSDNRMSAQRYQQHLSPNQLQRAAYSPQTGWQRQRSRAIAVKPRSREQQQADEVAEFSEQSNQQMYDWATWRMYHRIVDYRRTKGFPRATSESSPENKDHSFAYEGEPSNENMGQSLHCPQNDYGEIFEMDL